MDSIYITKAEALANDQLIIANAKSGIKGRATQSNAPTPYDAVTYPDGLFETYVVREPLTMPNSWGSAVTQAELNLNTVYFDVENGVITKVLIAKIAPDNAKIKNKWLWGKELNALPFYFEKTNYSRDVDGSIISSSQYSFDLPISDFRGKKTYFGVKTKPQAIGYGFFTDNNGDNIWGIPPEIEAIGNVDSDGYQLYSITHPTVDNIVPNNAVSLRIIIEANKNVKELYAGDVLYRASDHQEEYEQKTYLRKGIKISEVKFRESSTRAMISNNGTNISVNANGAPTIDLFLDFPKYLIGTKGFVNISIEKPIGNKAIYINLLAWNNFNGLIHLSPASIESGDVTFRYDFTSSDASQILLRLQTATADSFSINSISFSEQFITSSDLGIDAELNNNFETAYEIYEKNLQQGAVGGRTYKKVRDASVTPMNEVNNNEVYYNDSRRVISKLENITPVDLKGNTADVPTGRTLIHISKDGMMWFKNGYTGLEKISVTDFLENLESHDGSGVNADNINWVTAGDKVARLAVELPKWKQLKSSVPFVSVPSTNAVAFTNVEYANGTVQNSLNLIRKDGSIGNPKLKNLIVGNPTHLIIKIGNTVLHEIPLINSSNASSFRWGNIKADKGSITYENAIKCLMNFSNGKSLNVPVNLSAGTYTVVLRGRRYGNNLTDGTVSVNGGGTSSIITLSGNSYDTDGDDSSAVLVDFETQVTLSNSITSLSLTANCSTEKDFTSYNNGNLTIPAWGFTSNANHGFISEYFNPVKRHGFVYYSSDNGESFEVVFDISALETNDLGDGATSVNLGTGGGGHIHGGVVDLYWNKIWVLCGDDAYAKGIYHADLIDGKTSADSVKWKREKFQMPFYGSANGEQYCSVFPLKENVIFGTDCIPAGIFRMARLNGDALSKREPSKILSVNTLSHIPGSYYKADENAPTIIFSELTVKVGLVPKDQVPMLHATYEGDVVKEIWRDDIITPEWQGSFTKPYEYGGKVFITTFGTKRFLTDNALIIGEWNR